MKSVVLWQDRLRFRQYIKGKTHKYGVKFYKLCESDGLLLRSVIYSDFPRTWHPWLRTNWSNCPQIDGRFPAKRMVSFCRQFLQFCKACKASFKAENIHLWNSPWWSQGKPQRHWRKLKKGESARKRSNDFVVCKWKEKRDVLTISNNHSVKMVQYPTNVGSSPPSAKLYMITIMVCQE